MPQLRTRYSNGRAYSLKSPQGWIFSLLYFQTTPCSSSVQEWALGITQTMLHRLSVQTSGLRSFMSFEARTCCSLNMRHASQTPVFSPVKARKSFSTPFSSKYKVLLSCQPHLNPRHFGQASSEGALHAGYGGAEMRMLPWTLKFEAQFILEHTCNSFSPAANSNWTLINEGE